jgi:hypothetical protein
MRPRLGALIAVCLGCAEDSAPPLTQVIVLVGGEPLIDALDVRVYDAAGRTASSSRRIDLRRRVPHQLPTSFTVVPASPAGALRFRLVVQGVERAADGSLRERARRELLVSFAPGKTTLLPVLLSAECAGQDCDCPDDAACDRSCDPAASRCNPVPDFSELPEVVAGEEREALAEGFPTCAPGSFPAAHGGCVDIDECAFQIDACSVEPRSCVNLARPASVCWPGSRAMVTGNLRRPP